MLTTVLGNANGQVKGNWVPFTILKNPPPSSPPKGARHLLCYYHIMWHLCNPLHSYEKSGHSSPYYLTFGSLLLHDAPSGIHTTRHRMWASIVRCCSSGHLTNFVLANDYACYGPTFKWVTDVVLLGKWLVGDFATSHQTGESQLSHIFLNFN